MIRKFTLMVVGSMMLATTTFAQQRTEQSAQQIAKEKMQVLGLSSNVENVATSNNAKSLKGNTITPYYVFNGVNEKGFIIVSGDERMPDVVGYCTSGKYDEENLPDNLADFLAAYEETLAAVQAGDETATARVSEAATYRKSATITAVSPLITTQWNQGVPYNNLCPIISEHSTVTGCVATAMAQIMNYHEWPDTLQVGIPSYYYTLNGSRVDIDSIPPGTAYDWDNMLDSYDDSYTDEQAEAVATLMYHVGVANNMLYAWSSSAAYTPFEEFYEYFGYDEDLLQRLYASSYDLEDWNSILQQEVALGRPILYIGTSDDGGHAFVCDGVDSDGLYHINWGWGGLYDGYYDITILNPTKGGTGSGLGTDGYTRNCAAIVGIYPDNGTDDSYTYTEPAIDVNKIGSISLDSDGRSSETEALSISITYIFANETTEQFSGQVALGILGSDDSIKQIGTAESLTLNKRVSSITSSVSSKTISAEYAFPIGTYTIIPIYSIDSGLTWTACGSSDVYATIVEVTETSISQVSRKLTATLITENDVIYQNTENTLSLTLSNPYNVDYMGTIYVYGDSLSTKPSDYSGETYVRIASEDSLTYSFNIDIEDETEYYVWIDDEEGNTLVDGQKFEISEMSLNVSVVADNTLYANTTNELTVYVENGMSVSYSGNLYYYGSTDSIQPESYTSRKSVSLASGDSTSYSVTFNPGDSLSYYVWIKDSYDKLLVDGQKFEISENEEAVLTLEGVETNASTTDFVTDSVYYQGHLIKVPRVYGDTLTITYKIKNDGGVCRTNYYLRKREYDETYTSYTASELLDIDVTLDADTTTTITVSVTKDQFDTPYAFVYLTGDTEFAEEIKNKIELSDGGYLTMTSTPFRIISLGYFSDITDTGIKGVLSDGLQIAGGKGKMIVSTSNAQNIRVISTGGVLLHSFTLSAGETKEIVLLPGVYIVNGRKIVVR